jgi:vacuolar protein sorting-associated protein 51
MASPRPSLSNIQSPPSSRTSQDASSTAGSVPPSLSRAVNPQGRRNRAALRDYYGLKSPSTADIHDPTDISRSSSVDPNQDSQSRLQSSTLDPLDREGFDAGSHVRQVLENESLQSLLAYENELVSEIKTLGGERKALVYDNYSKLISATDTIKKVCMICPDEQMGMI